ncbi:MAG: FAD-dependent oxidoreductase [Parachlamydiaceae bacterium]|nr:FAD-dependent oxidoreductase [Parachlamydiaceae bacterium]
MKVAIVGAGFCGLAVAWNLLKRFPDVTVTLYDKNGIGGGASGIAAGLLHPFSGAHAKLNRKGFEGIEETKQLLNIASDALNEPVISVNKGILRLALTQLQEGDFKFCAKNHPNETAWLDSDECQKLIPQCTAVPGLWIKDGITVHCLKYLNGLWKACEKKGAQLVIQSIENLQVLNTFDQIILTIGSGFKYLPELKLPLTFVKGQVLELQWPLDIPPLNYPINSNTYIAMKEGNQSCFVGATYERDFSHEFEDIEIAKNELLSKAIELYPPLKDSQILKSYAGVRVSTPNHLPIIKEISPNQWILTGMGSKGLLYHALYAKELVDNLYNQ